MASLLLLTTLLTFPLVFGLKLFLASPAVPVLLLASPAVPVVSRVAVGPAVDVFLLLLFCRWRVSAIAAFPAAVEVSSDTGVYNVPGGPCYCWRLFCCWLPCCCCLLSVVGLPAVTGVPGVADDLIVVAQLLLYSTGVSTFNKSNISETVGHRTTTVGELIFSAIGLSIVGPLT